MTLKTALGAIDTDSPNTLEEIAAYHAARGNAAWEAEGDDETQEQAARRATFWLDGRYRSRLPGVKRYGRDQAIEFPRTGGFDAAGQAIPDDTYPPEYKAAHAEASLRELVSPGSLYPVSSNGLVLRAISVGPIRKEYDTSAATAPVSAQVEAIDDILAPLLNTGRRIGGAATVRLMRV